VVLQAHSTYCYAATVPEGGAASSPWTMDRADTFESLANSETASSALSDRPLLHITDAGIISNPSVSRPSVIRCGLRLASVDDTFHANTQFIDKALIHACRSGNRFYMAYTNVGGTGISLVRNGKLIFAVGEISAVPLGEDFVA